VRQSWPFLTAHQPQYGPAACKGRGEGEERLLMATPCKQRYGNPGQNKARGKNTGESHGQRAAEESRVPVQNSDNVV